MAKSVVPRKPKKKPVFEGERLSSTSKEKLLCRKCNRLATHTALHDIEIQGQLSPQNLYFCDVHLNEAIQAERKIYSVRILPKYRLYLGQLKRWNAAENFEETQAAML